ncbi:hypothetical protein J6590_070345 [Homalodisca vitripennis]|nr:hypothetical protein J6590_070345 [Homalodisca vitripennis]
MCTPGRFQPDEGSVLLQEMVSLRGKTHQQVEHPDMCTPGRSQPDEGSVLLQEMVSLRGKTHQQVENPDMCTPGRSQPDEGSVLLQEMKDVCDFPQCFDKCAINACKLLSYAHANAVRLQHRPATDMFAHVGQ